MKRKFVILPICCLNLGQIEITNIFSTLIITVVQSMELKGCLSPQFGMGEVGLGCRYNDSFSICLLFALFEYLYLEHLSLFTTFIKTTVSV